jgi:hypothetical protein
MLAPASMCAGARGEVGRPAERVGRPEKPQLRTAAAQNLARESGQQPARPSDLSAALLAPLPQFAVGRHDKRAGSSERRDRVVAGPLGEHDAHGTISRELGRSRRTLQHEDEFLVCPGEACPGKVCPGKAGQVGI